VEALISGHLAITTEGTERALFTDNPIIEHVDMEKLARLVKSFSDLNASGEGVVSPEIPGILRRRRPGRERDRYELRAGSFRS
jgi:hypothetical protein